MFLVRYCCISECASVCNHVDLMRGQCVAICFFPCFCCSWLFFGEWGELGWWFVGLVCAHVVLWSVSPPDSSPPVQNNLPYPATTSPTPHFHVSKFPPPYSLYKNHTPKKMSTPIPLPLLHTPKTQPWLFYWTSFNPTSTNAKLAQAAKHAAPKQCILPNKRCVIGSVPYEIVETLQGRHTPSG